MSLNWCKQNSSSTFVKLKIFFIVHRVSEELRKEKESKTKESIAVDRWDELVRDLWEEKYLKHLWEAAVDYEETNSFVYDPSTGKYGFQDLVQSDEDCAYMKSPDIEDDSPTNSHTSPSLTQKSLQQTQEELGWCLFITPYMKVCMHLLQMRKTAKPFHIYH